jgi:hypothetical protein
VGIGTFISSFSGATGIGAHCNGNHPQLEWPGPGPIAFLIRKESGLVEA